MRAVVIGLVAAVAATSAVSQPTPALPAFQFKTFTAAMPLADAQAANLAVSCSETKLSSGPVTFCGLGPALIEGGVSGVKPRRSSLQYNAAGLIAMSWQMFRSEVPLVRAAFEQRYGKPCKTETAQLQNGYGAQFKSEVVSWCFSDGDLILAERALNDPLNGEFLFVSRRYQAEGATPKPTVNF
jgi:hypothetical protein